MNVFGEGFIKSDVFAPMDFNELRFFMAVAEEGSVSRTATRFNCVQSNVTVRLRQLEERLNVTFFHRKSRGVALTAAGRVLLDYAVRIIVLVREAERIVPEREPWRKVPG